MSAAMAADQCRFVRRTTLNPEEYRTNFRQIDCEVIEVLTSPEADQVTSQMSKIYLRLTNAHRDYWEREGVLRFVGEEREGKWQTAWEQLVSLAGVASATARKALAWMARQGIIGYFAGKNGVGIRIFINRAASSIRQRPGHPQKNLRLIQASTGESRTSAVEAGFKESHADRKILDLDLIPRAPGGGADNDQTEKVSPAQSPCRAQDKQLSTLATKLECSPMQGHGLPSVDDIIRRLKVELEPALRTAAAQAAVREHERTREWLENRGLPKAARVAQREAFNVLRQQGVIIDSRRRARTELLVGHHDHIPYKPKLLTLDELKEIAEICVSMLEGQGQAIDVTLAQISAEAGGYLLPEDAPKARELAESLAHQRNQKE